MKKTISGVVNDGGWMLSSAGGGVWLDITIPAVVGPPRGTKVEISWDEPGPKTQHECGQIPPGCRIFKDGPVWWLSQVIETREIRENTQIVFCPYCGEKLEGAQ